jgi:hypothetical protein
VPKEISDGSVLLVIEFDGGPLAGKLKHVQALTLRRD